MRPRIVGEAVAVGGIGVLDRHLHVVEAEQRQPLQALAGQQHTGGDEVGIETDLGRLRHDLLEVAAHGGLAPRQMQLQDAQVGCLRQHVEPHLRRQLAGNALQRQRIGAIGALQRAAVRQLGEQPDRSPQGGRGIGLCGSRSRRYHALVGELLQHRDDIGEDAVPGAL